MRQAIITKYLSPTTHRGSRIKAKAFAGEVTVSWDYSKEVVENHEMAALALAKKYQWDNDYIGGSLPAGDGYVFVACERGE